MSKASESKASKSKVSEKPQQTVELMFNQMAADQMVLRITLQCILLNMFRTRPEQAPKLLADMKAQVLATIGNIQPSAENPEPAARQKQLTQARGERLFQELETVIGSANVEPKADKSN